MDDAVDTTMDAGPGWWEILGYVVTLLMACAGLLLGGACGWAAGEGVNTVIGAGIGFAVFFCIGCVACGPLKHLMNNTIAELAPPEMSRVMLTGTPCVLLPGLASYYSFDLYVTVHSVQNVYNTEGIFGWFGKQNDSFVQVRTGRRVDGKSQFLPSRNPPKRTRCIQSTVFEEVFTLVVAPTDEWLEVTLFDQDMITEEEVGKCYIDITNSIMKAGFPQKRGYKLLRESGLIFLTQEEARAGVVILSFQPGSDFPRHMKQAISENAPMSVHDMLNTRSRMIKRVESQDAHGNMNGYGTWATSTGKEDLNAWRAHHIVADTQHLEHGSAQV